MNAQTNAWYSILPGSAKLITVSTVQNQEDRVPRLKGFKESQEWEGRIWKQVRNHRQFLGWYVFKRELCLLPQKGLHLFTQ